MTTTLPESPTHANDAYIVCQTGMFKHLLCLLAMNLLLIHLIVLLLLLLWFILSFCAYCLHFFYCTSIDSFDGDVRLIGTTDDTTGVVEYYRDGIGWTTICSTEWDDTDAGIVCKTVGYDGGTATTYK